MSSSLRVSPCLVGQTSEIATFLWVSCNILYFYDHAIFYNHVISIETPILGSRLPIRRETMKTALEHHFEHVEERKQSKMQTLGASNPHNNNKDKHRQNAKITADTVGEIFNVGPGIYL